MLEHLKKKIDAELHSFVNSIESNYGLSAISPLLAKSIKDFIQREGKRVRPILFVIGYLGYAKKEAKGLFTSAVSIELLHDFMLVHDDIIDKSDTRRGKPSVHKMFNTYLAKFKGAKFSGEDLAIVAGDVLYAMGIQAFLSIDEEKRRKEKALRQLIKAALYTGYGEFSELLYGVNKLKQLKRRDIFKIYDYKTAYYTFSSPLAIGALLAGATEREANKLVRYGVFLGRAFQIKDDILGLFGEEKQIGKSVLSDLQEEKKTLLIWYAYHNGNARVQSSIERIMRGRRVTRGDLMKMRRIVIESDALNYAKNEISRCKRQALSLLGACAMKPAYQAILKNYSQEILSL